MDIKGGLYTKVPCKVVIDVALYPLDDTDGKRDGAGIEKGA